MLSLRFKFRRLYYYYFMIITLFYEKNKIKFIIFKFISLFNYYDINKRVY
jgi:hypothetical protein